MRKLTFLVLFVAALYGAYWFVGARAVETGARDALSDLAAAGWKAEYSDLNTIGFPSRFDTTVSDLRLAAPDGRIAWRGAFIQIFALSYQPNKVIAVFPPEFDAQWNGMPFNVKSTNLRASGEVRANTGLSLSAATIEIAEPVITVPDFAVVNADRFLTAIRQSDSVERGYDVFLTADQVVLDGMETWVTGRDLPNRITLASFDGTLQFDRPLDRFAFDGSDPAVTQVTIKTMVLDLPDMSIAAEGAIDVDAAGVPTGRVTFKTADWRQLIDFLVTIGAIDSGIAPTVTNLARTMSAASGRLELPLSFQNGFMSLGPLPLGPAPRFR